MKLRTRIVEKPWGRRDLPAAFGLTTNAAIGEIWFEHPDGDAAPILVKFLFTSQRLSIQVHPDDAAAHAAGLPRGKDECWLVLDATNEAELGVGLNQTCSADALRTAAVDGSIEAMLDWRSVKAGDFIYNPAGTIHALGAGLMIVEIQQNVDCTYRLYDYGRPRALHLDAAMRVANRKPHRDNRDRHVPADGQIMLVDGPHFCVVRADGPLDTGAIRSARQIQIVPLRGECCIDGERLCLGESAIAAQADNVVIAPGAQALLCWTTD